MALCLCPPLLALYFSPSVIHQTKGNPYARAGGGDHRRTAQGAAGSPALTRPRAAAAPAARTAGASRAAAGSGGA